MTQSAQINSDLSIASAENGQPIKHGVSVDVEDYFQVWGFSDVIKRESWDGFSLRVGDNTRLLLDFFDSFDVKATFYTLGWVAERDPVLIQEIVSRGHELASHGYDHTKVFDQSETEFLEDAGKTKKILEDISGSAVTGYRAAGFSMDKRTPFAHDVLAELGYLYSSSSHPIVHDHYGDPEAPQTKFHPIAGSDFIEAPVATTNWMGRRISCAGGGWFRAMPYPVTKNFLHRAEKEFGQSLIFYFHPWEIDKDQPRIEGVAWKRRLRHYINIDKMQGKLNKLMKDFQWSRVDHVLGITREHSVS